MSARIPKFAYGQGVKIVPLEGVEGRVLELHYYTALDSIQYEVRYFHECKEYRVRLFEDELTEAT